MKTDYLDQIFKNYPLPSLILQVMESDYKIIKASDRFLSIFELDELEIIGKDVNEVCEILDSNTENISSFIENLNTSNKSQKALSKNVHVILGKSQVLVCDIELISFFDSKNKIDFIQIIIDNSSNKESYKSIIDNLERSEEIAKLGYWQLDLKTKKIIGSAGAMRIYGYEKNHASFEEIMNLRLPEYRETLQNALTDLIEKDIPYDVEFKIKRASDGKILDLHSKGNINRELGFVAGIIQDITDRKNIEKEILLSEKKWKTILEVSPIPMALNNEKQEITFLNNAFVNLFGYTIADIPNLKNWWLKAYPDKKYRTWAKKTWLKAVDNSIKSGIELSPMEYEVCCKNGEKKTILISAKPIDESTQNLHLVILYDITERKQEEQKQIESLQIIEGIMNSINVRVFWKDKNLRYLGCNKNFAMDAGFDNPEDLIGKDDYEMIWHHQADLYRKDDMQVIESNCPKLNIEEPQTAPDGTTITLLTNKIPLKNAKGEIYGVLGSYLDITERKQTEEDILKNKIYLHTILQSTIDGILAVDLKGNIIFHNDRFKELWNIPQELINEKNDKKLLNYVFNQLSNPEDFIEKVNRLYKSDEKSFDSIDFKDGRTFERLSQTLVLNSKTHGRVWSFRDVTEKKKNDLELIKSNRIQALYSKINELIIRIHDKRQLFEEVCEIATTFGNFRMSWISQADEESKVLTPLVWNGHEDGYLKEITKISIEKNLSGNGPTGISFREGKVSICNNIAADPKMKPWREEAIKRGYFSSIALPIIVRKKVIGTFNLYSGEVDFFAKKEEVELLENITANISYSIEKILDEEDRIKAEQKVREKDIEFRKLSNHVPDLIFQFTRRPDGSYYVPIASLGIRNIFGCEPEDVMDNFEAIARVIHPEDAERVINEIELSAKNISLFTCEFRVQIPGKEVQWIYSKSSPEKLPDGSITWYGFNVNITQRKQAEETLLQLSRAVEQSPATIVITDTKGNIQYVNPMFTQTTGYSLAEVLGKNPRVLKSGETTQEEYKFLWDSISSGKEWFGELHNKKKNGELYWESAHISPIIDKQGKIISFLAVKTDVTVQKQIREELIKSNQRYHLVAKATNDSIWDLNLITEEISHTGDGFKNLFGYGADEVKKLKWKNLVHPDDLAELLESQNMVFSNPNTFLWEFEYRLLKANGEYAFVHDKAYIVRNEKGKAIRLIGATQDISERVAHIKSIEEQNKKLRDIAWKQSHIVRAPVARIMGLINLLSDEKSLNDETNNLLKYIEESALELDNIIRSIVENTIIENDSK